MAVVLLVVVGHHSAALGALVVVLLVVVGSSLDHLAQLVAVVDALGLLVLPSFASQHQVDAGFPVDPYFSVVEG